MADPIRNPEHRGRAAARDQHHRQAVPPRGRPRQGDRRHQVRGRPRLSAHVLRPAGPLDRPHATIKSIDFSEAAKVPGFLGSLTGQETPIPFGILPVSQDEHALCPDKVRFVGDPVAAVAAVTEDAAYEAALRVKVEYEPLATISSIEEALATPEPRIHDYGDRGNLHKVVSMTFGEVEKGFEEADEIFEDTFYYEGNTHLPMEQHASVAVPEDDDRVTALLLHPDAALRPPRPRQGARAAGLARPRRRLLRTAAASAARAIRSITRSWPRRWRSSSAGRCKITLTREEVFYCHRGRHPVLMQMKTGVKKDGNDHRPAPAHRPRRRRLRQLRRGLHLLHRRAADGDLQAAGLRVPGGALLHQQAPLRPQARPRHAAAALRLRGPSRQDRRSSWGSIRPTCGSTCWPSRIRSPPTG